MVFSDSWSFAPISLFAKPPAIRRRMSASRVGNAALHDVGVGETRQNAEPNIRADAAGEGERLGDVQQRVIETEDNEIGTGALEIFDPHRRSIADHANQGILIEK